MNFEDIDMLPDVFDRLADGDLSRSDLGAYAIILAQANPETGVWAACAGRLDCTSPRKSTLRDAQRSIKRLEGVGFIKRFRERVPGVRGNYVFLINNFRPSMGRHAGERLNADKKTDWNTPVWEVVGEAERERIGEACPTCGAPMQLAEDEICGQFLRCTACRYRCATEEEMALREAEMRAVARKFVRRPHE